MRPYSASVRIADPSGFVLYVRRSATAPTRAGQFERPAGIVEPGEHPAHTACREVEEETGIVLVPHLLRLREIERGANGDHYNYEATLSGRPPVRLSFEHDAYMWRPTYFFSTR